MKGRILNPIMGLLLALTLLLVPSGPAAAEQPYKIGFITSVTGFMGPMGSGARDAAELVTERINSQGGINGHPLELALYDDGSDPSKGVMALKKLINEDKVLMVVGPLSTGIAMACAPIADQTPIPLFAQCSSSWAVALKPWELPHPPQNIREWVFKTGIDPIFHDVAIFKMLKKVGARKLAHLNVNNAMGKAMTASFKSSYQDAGFEVLVWEEYGPTDTDLTVPLTKIKASGCDAVIIAGAEMAGAIAYKQAREMGMKQPFIASPPLVMGKIMAALGDSLDGLQVPSFVVNLGEDLSTDDPQRKPVVELNELIRSRTKSPRADTGHTAGWDGIYLAKAALESADPDLSDLKKARTQVREALENLKGYVGVQAVGDMSKWHEIPAPMIPCEVRGGKLIAIGEKITPTWADME